MPSSVTTAQLQRPAMAAETNGRPVDPSAPKTKQNGHITSRGASKIKPATSGFARKSFSLVSRFVQQTSILLLLLIPLGS